MQAYHHKLNYVGEAITLQNVNIRATPNGESIGVLPPFTMADIEDWSANDGGLIWWKVKAGSLSGWVAQMAANYTILLLPYDGTDFNRSMVFTLHAEGGQKENDPDDPGLTRWGVCQRFNPHIDVANLTIEQMYDFYFKECWLRSGAHLLQWPLCTAVFDAVVNMGMHAALSLLSDGITAEEYNVRRRAYYRRLSNFDTYGTMWLARVAKLDEYLSDPR